MRPQLLYALTSLVLDLPVTCLREIPFLFWFQTDQFDPFKAPTSKELLESMLDALRLDGSNPKDIFCYSCLSCRIKVRKTPID
jgi:hypothetical protein